MRVQKYKDYDELYGRLVEKIQKVYIEPKLKLRDKNCTPEITLKYKLTSQLYSEGEINLESGEDLEILMDETEDVRIIVYVEGTVI